MPLDDDPTLLTANELSARIHARTLSCRELMQATLDRIARLNPAHNAIVSLADAGTLLAQADAADAELAAGRSRGWLHGIPMAIKDTIDAVGFPSTRGSPLLAGQMPRQDGIATARLRAAGAIFIGKTNVPESGLGSHTFNEVFGTTFNAWDPVVSAGGSSGGAAVALALRMLSVADGSDFMGSLRNPAGWNHVFGMRPTQGRVPVGPAGTDLWLDKLTTEGPMARSVADLARLLATQSGHDPRDPMSLESTLEPLAAAGDAAALRGLRIGFLGDLDGYLPMEDGVLDACDDALRHMERAGAVVEAAPLGTDPARLWDCWLTWRRGLAGTRMGALLALPGARERMKPEALWEYEGSLGLGFPEFMRASQVRSGFYRHMLKLLDHWDVLALPSAQCWPFDAGLRWPAEVAGRPMDTYHRWMEVTIYATLACTPALCVPAGFHPDRGWPMGLQLIARPGADAFLLRVAAGYEAARAAFIARQPPVLAHAD